MAVVGAALGIMTEEEEEEDSDKMQKIHETSLERLKSKESQYNPLERGIVAEGLLKVKDEINVQGDIAGSNESFNRDVTTSLNQVYSRPFYRQEVFTLPNIPMDIQMPLQNHLNPFKNQFYPTNRDCSFPVENGIPYVPFKMLPQAHPRDIQYQGFQYFVVIDFEATCDKEKNPHPQEIIEFPSVLVNSMTGQLEAYFQTYVRPVYHQLLTDFCKELTGIQQIQVDRGVSLNDALLMHDKWLEDKGIKHKNFAVVTWSNWDCNVMLESECRFKSIRKPHYFNRWINLRVPFQEVFGGRPLCSLKEAVQLAGLEWEGRPHCGLDDARNTAHLLTILMHLGYKFSITNSLARQSSEGLTEPFQQPQKPKELVDPFSKEHRTYCHCGVLSSKCVVRKPGPTQGRFFFGCGNWTAARRSVCNYFMWASP